MEDMCDRIMSEVADSRARADRGMITKATEDLTTQGQCESLSKEGHAESIL